MTFFPLFYQCTTSCAERSIPRGLRRVAWRRSCQCHLLIMHFLQGFRTNRWCYQTGIEVVVKHQTELSSVTGQGSQSRVGGWGVGFPQIHDIWLGEGKMHFGEMAKKTPFCGAISQICRQSVVQALVRAGGHSWPCPVGTRTSLQGSASCQRLLLSAQEAEGCWAVTFLHNFHHEHHWRVPDFQFFPVEL